MDAPKSPGRSAKLSRTCFQCKNACSPKNGDWFLSPEQGSPQVFLCKDCERAPRAAYQRTTKSKY